MTSDNKRISSSDIRQQFLEFFSSKGHEIVASSPLIPANDKTLLFTNAGMVQFKDVFLGVEQRAYNKAVSSQRCVRAGGKHNDLENVGYTARHHTFFEMLGNFSFGDYFKRDAIHYAWEFLTEVIGLPKEKLWVTVFEEDSEAEDIWLNDIGIAANKVIRIGAKDNFWQMGDTGPCGPCSEIFYDHGDAVWGGPPGTTNEEGDRYIEIWNLVFMQYNRNADGVLTPLPKPSVDTGMGLERLAAILQGVHSNYDIDLFQHLIQSAAKITGTNDLTNVSLRVIADHIRSCAFMVVDGVLPANDGRGYVLRRIIRRALRHGHKLGQKGLFFSQLVSALVDVMGQAYPELAAVQSKVEKVLLKEEQRFAETLDQGMKILEMEIKQLAKDDTQLSGDIAFKLYDTYGFPFDLTADIARERQLTVDEEGFNAAMQVQREQSRNAGQFLLDYTDTLKVKGETQFTGYENVVDQGVIQELFMGSESVDSLDVGVEAKVVMRSTPFYAESGGQVGDSGQLIAKQGVFHVSDTQKQGKVFIHYGKLDSGTLQLNETVTATVDTVRRQAITLNHSATHLMHTALRDVLGDHVEQKGSLVNDERLRFDFSHFEGVNQAQINTIERLVNQQIRQNSKVETRYMTMDDALKTGAMALFGEKYDDEVRVVNIGYSTELCGGVHVRQAGDIGLFKILSESGVASGVRRIEAVTGEKALESVIMEGHTLAKVAGLVKTTITDIENKVTTLLNQNRQLEKELQQAQSKLASQSGNNLMQKAVEVNGINVLTSKIEAADSKVLREMVDQLKNKLGRSVIVLSCVNKGKISLIAGVTKPDVQTIKAGDLVNFVAQQVGGKGGGRPDMAQAGGNLPDHLDVALASVIEWVRDNT